MTGITGFAVDPEHGLSTIDAVSRLDRRQVRGWFEQRFTDRRMAQDYTAIYEDALANSAERSLRAAAAI